jgi:hypothetical protein
VIVLEKNGILAVKEGYGNVWKCCRGVVHIQVHSRGFLHFREDSFLYFASMIKEASSRLMDEGLAGLIEDSEVRK